MQNLENDQSQASRNLVHGTHLKFMMCETVWNFNEDHFLYCLEFHKTRGQITRICSFWLSCILVLTGSRNKLQELCEHLRGEIFTNFIYFFFSSRLRLLGGYIMVLWHTCDAFVLCSQVNWLLRSFASYKDKGNDCGFVVFRFKNFREFCFWVSEVKI